MFSSFSDRAAWMRTRRLARHSGLDLAEAVVEGWLSRGELDQIVSDCQSCGADTPCEAQAAPGPDPAACPTLRALESLRP